MGSDVHGVFGAAIGVTLLAIVYLCVTPKVTVTHLVISIVIAATLLAAWALVERQKVAEFFAPAFRVCMGPGDSECQADNSLPDDMDAGTIAALPLRPCAMYFTNNVNECEMGMYQKSKLELMDLRAQYEASPDTFAEQLLQVNRVLADYDTIYLRQCKLTFNNWMRPDHASMPVLRVSNAELVARGNPRHWAFCFAPTPTPNAKEALDALINTNTTANGNTLVVTPSDFYTLSTGINTRIEFNTLEKRDLVNTFCTIFTPSLDANLQPHYAQLNNNNILYAIDMTNDGIIKGVDLYAWNDGYLTKLPETMVDFESYQDDIAKCPYTASMPHDPSRFALESLYHCTPPALKTQIPKYVDVLKRLFTPAIVSGNLVYQLSDTARMYVFNINACNRVDKIETKNILNLLAFFGNAIPAATPLLGSTTRLYNELKMEKATAHAAVCDLAADMTVTFNEIADVNKVYDTLSGQYISNVKADTNTLVTMAPYTTAAMPSFEANRIKDVALHARFNAERDDKLEKIATIDRINLSLAEIELKMKNAAETLRTVVRNKRIAVTEKPYTYISNDGRVYFQMR